MINEMARDMDAQRRDMVNKGRIGTTPIQTINGEVIPPV
jgi:hypothetical protein